MAKKDEVKQISEEQAIADELRRQRREAAEAKKGLKQADLDQKEEFRKFFAKINGKLKLDKDMEKVIWLHFKAYGFAEKEKFEEGIRHFGYKI